MKKLLFLLFGILSIGAVAQNGKTEILVAPNSNSPYILVDTLFTLEDTSITTDIYIHFANPTASAVKAVQFRLFYDNTKFSNVQVFWGPTALSIPDKYGSYFKSGDYVNIIGTYTGNNQNFDWSDGAMFKVRLTHGSTYQGVVNSMATTGTTSYSNLATTGNGTDVTLGLFNYGGAFQMQPITFPIRVKNADGSAAQGVWFSASKRLKSTPQSTWQPITSDSTNALGLVSFTHPLDTAYWNLKITAQTDTMSDGGAISITDAYKLANHTSMQDTLSGIEWYEGDVNQSQTVTISDAFAVFNRLALQSTDWDGLFTGVNNVSVLWPNEYTTAVSATGIPNWTTSPRRYQIDTIVNSLDSINPYIYVVGDATTTGYNNPAVIMARIVNPGNGTEYILDPAVYMVNRDDTVQFRIPKLLIANNQMEVPVTMFTFGNKIGAAQMGIEFDTTIFQFNSIKVGDDVSKWTSLISVEKGRVFFAGHEDKMNPSLVETMTNQFTFVFDVISPIGWQTSPLRIFDKSAGNEKAEDLSIKPSPNDGSVVNRNSMNPDLAELMTGFKVYPNPVTDLTDGWLVIEHFNEYRNSDFTGVIYNIGGQVSQVYQTKITNIGFQVHGINVKDLPNGVYFVKLVTADREKVVKIVKY